MRLVNLVIANTGTISNSIEVIGIDQITIYGPAALTGVVSIEVDPGDGNFIDTTLDIIADGLTRLVPVHGNFVRLVSTLAEGAERTFPVHGSTLVIS